MKHTETRIAPVPYAVTCDGGKITDRSGDDVAMMKPRIGKMATAKYIVHCVNAHEKLVEALKRSRGYVESYNIEHPNKLNLSNDIAELLNEIEKGE